ncbi:hypothetical protein pEaSNUABM11_00245 [Erwinia phage pEa_SNUABM_11]|nr:hypothetical protein pEaSNUABM11_00245 [Erwinia phage pEa_SNUABM_11]
MRVYIDFNTENVYDAFDLGYEGVLERTLAHHRLLIANHENPTVRENEEYYRSVVYQNHLSSILYKAFKRFHDAIVSQLVCFNTKLPVDPEEDPVEKLLNLSAMDVLRELLPLDTKLDIEHMLFDEESQELLFNELEEFRDELIRVVRREIADALTVAIMWAKK